MNLFSKRILPVAMAFLILIGASTFVVSAAGAADTHTVTTVDELKAALSAIGESGTGTIVLGADLDNVSGITIGNNQKITLLGNGHSISFASKTCLSVSGNAVLNLGESGNPAASKLDLTRAVSNDDPGVLSLSGSAKVNMYDGVTIRDANNNNYFGGGVTIGGQSSSANHAVFTMYGGTIKNCGVYGGGVCYGGGVSVCNGGTFIMNGGTISDCYATTSSPNPTSDNATGSGGGVFVGSGSSFVMNGGLIDNCTASANGGGVAIYTSAQSDLGKMDSEFTMNGGTIGNCVCKGMGGGVYATGRIVNANAIAAPTGSAGTVTNKGIHILGGSVTNNTADVLGGGIGLFELSRDGLVAEIKNTNITRNSAPEGGGIGSLLYWTHFNVDNCVITDNTAEVGGGIAIDGYNGSNGGNKPIASVTNTTIGNNLASLCASDVYVYDAQMTLNRAENSEILYTNTQPTDLSYRKIEKWYVDGVERFVDQDSADRVVQTELNLTWSSKNEHMLIAAPTPDSSQGSGEAQFVVTKDFPLKKNFVWSEGFDNAGDSIADIEDRVSTDATFVIAPYTSYNREVGKTDIPTFDPSSYTIPVSSGTKEITITTPNYYSAGIGDYWYTVTEQPIDNVAGVAVDTTATRYLHVQVQWNGAIGGDMEVASVTLHSAAPSEDGTYNNTEKGTDGSDKTDGFTNTYGAGSLEITKLVTGNMGDPDKLFMITVKFTAPAGKVVTGDIKYVGGYEDENGTTAYTDVAPGEIAADWNGSETVTVYLKKDATVTFTNIPDGVTYEIAENDYTGEGYEVAYAGDNETGDVASATKFTGTITDSLDKVTITNTKDVAIDVGVILDNAPFILLLVGSMAFFAVYFVTKRRKEEETY